MADVDAANLALSNESCRIFTISSSLARATSFIDRVRNLGNAQSPPSPSVEPSAVLPSNSAGLSMPVKIPWTISNKYYSASVHFAAHTIHGLSPHHLQNAPAVIFVWAQGEPYQHDIERISQDLTGREPEVCLAVRVPHLQSDPVDEDDSEIDAFLSSHGFEYVDATEEKSSQRSVNVHEGSDFAGIPRLPRVLDALSTILWPSMETKSGKANRDIRQQDREFLDWAQDSQDDRYSAVGTGTESLGSTRSRVREMQELARWLEEDDSYGGGDPWRTAASSAAISLSLTSMEPEIHGTLDGRLGFDDDFTVFVSAPAVDSNEIHSGRSSPDISTGNLSATQGNDLYRSLGSVSDFGGSDDGKRGNNVESDDDIPTQDEIQATSSRIFGVTQSAGRGANAGSPSLPQSSSIISPITDTLSFDFLRSEPETDEDDDPHDIAPFDLSKVVGTLEEMKAEIGRMEDEGARRKAAARVALGLVYGLERGVEV